MSLFSANVCRTAGDAVCQSRTLAEALDRNPCETQKKRALWERTVVALWNVKCSEEHTEQLNRVREGSLCPQ